MRKKLVERLRCYEIGNLAMQETWVREMHEVADEIERLNGRMRVKLALAQSETERLRTALEPFGRNAKAKSISGALSHISREDLILAHELTRNPMPSAADRK